VAWRGVAWRGVAWRGNSTHSERDANFKSDRQKAAHIKGKSSALAALRAVAAFRPVETLAETFKDRLSDADPAPPGV